MPVLTALSKSALRATSWFRNILNAFKSEPYIVPVKQSPEAKPAEADSLPPFPSDYTVVYITTERQANDELRQIQYGAVGIDTEFTERRPTKEEHTILKSIPAGTNKRLALLGWQIVELATHCIFPVAWDNIGLRLIQIAYGEVVWVLDMWKIRCVPKELRRILLAVKIPKTGVGLLKDISVVWDDLRMEMKNLVDCGMMARLLLAEKYQKQAYGNLSLKTSVEDVLGFTIDKDLQQSDWIASKLTDEQLTYAALDAVASLRLYELLTGRLEDKSKEIEKKIPEGWYTFNTKLGEPTRTTLGPDDSEIIWKHSDCTWYGAGKFQGHYP
ncbi:ribonuclease H-like domain-containing protein [Mycena leptocephala]|nr:ribonuclease H-like domain-containing protein [Mycena leptocephala]